VGCVIELLTVISISIWTLSGKPFRLRCLHCWIPFRPLKV